MWLIVGLGNPGSKYQFTRHNVGFMAVDLLAEKLRLRFQSQFKGEFAKGSWGDHQIGLLKPQTYMNLSGQSVQPCLGFYKIPLSQLIVLHDDLDQPFAQIRIQKNRGHGGHNGIKDISAMMASMDYARIKMGIGRPPHADFSVADYVLQNFSGEEMKALPEFLHTSLDAAEAIIKNGAEKAANVFNQATMKK